MEESEESSVLTEECLKEPRSLDNESGYEDGLSDRVEVSSARSNTEEIDSLITDTSVLTLQTDTDSGNSLNTRQTFRICK